MPETPAPAAQPASPHHAPDAKAERKQSRRLFIAAAFAAVILALIFWGAILKNPSYWGVRDWGFHLYMQSAVKEPLLKFGQLPFWDPYRCGGNVALAHPEFPGFNLLFFLVLLMPTMLAFKVGIVVYAALGLLGAWLLGRQMKLHPIAAALPAILYVLNSSLFLYLAEGNFWSRAVVWLPWVAYFWMKCGESRKYALPCGAFFLLILLDTNTYLFGVTLFFLAAWAALDALTHKRKTYLVALALACLAVGLFGAFKLIPLYDYGSQFPTKQADVESGYTWKSLTTGLLNKEQDPYGHWFADRRPFFHHGIYVGWLGLTLGLLGALLAWRKWFLWLCLAILALIISFGKNAIPNLYFIIKALPFYNYYHEATRFIPITMLALGLFAGYLLDRILRIKSITAGGKSIPLSTALRTGIAIGVLALLLSGLYTVNTAVLPKVFIAPPLPLGPAGEKYIQINSPYGSNPWADGQLLPQGLYYNVWGHMMVLNLFQNKGTTKGNCHGSVGLHAQPSVFEDGTPNPAYRGEAYLESTNGTARITEFTNNRIQVHAEAQGPGLLVLNQNHYREWRAKGGAGDLQSKDGLLAVPVAAGASDITFWYSPRLFIAGLIVSLLAIIGGILAFRKWRWLETKLKLLA